MRVRSYAVIGSLAKRSIATLALAAASLALAAPAALATNRIYWTNFAGAESIPFVNLDGSGTGGNLNQGGATLNSPAGVALDPATNKVYWANYAGDSISFANLDGSGGGGQLNTSPVTPDHPAGVALDAATGKIYWADMGSNQIEFANLNGSGGGVVTATGASTQPEGVTLDAATGQIYWADFGNDTIDFANLDGGGEGTLITTGATVVQPIGVAIDFETDQIFWANSGSGIGGNSIGFANLNNVSGGGDLNTAPVTPNNPQGVTIDSASGQIYWANFQPPGAQTIDVANVNDTGGGAVVNTGGVMVSFPTFPALLEAPAGAGRPAVSGGGAAPTTLSCTGGSWAGDAPSSLLYRAPRSFSYAWTDGGVPIAGATGSTLNVSAGGNYACVVTAHNQAGATSQTSASWGVAPTMRIASTSISGATASLTLVCEGASGQSCAGGITGTATERRRGSTILAVSARAPRHRRRPRVKTATVTVATASYSIGGGKSATVRISLNGTGKRPLAQFYRLPVELAFSGTINQTVPITYEYSRVHPTVHPFWTWTNVPCSPCFTSVDTLTLTGLRSGESVTLRCSGPGCPFGHRTIKRRGSRLALAGRFAGAHLGPGASVQIRVTAPNEVGFVQFFTILTGRLPRSAVKCLPPGARSPTACA